MTTINITMLPDNGLKHSRGGEHKKKKAKLSCKASYDHIYAVFREGLVQLIWSHLLARQDVENRPTFQFIVAVCILWWNCFSLWRKKVLDRLSYHVQKYNNNLDLHNMAKFEY